MTSPGIYPDVRKEGWGKKALKIQLITVFL